MAGHVAQAGALPAGGDHTDGAAPAAAPLGGVPALDDKPRTPLLVVAVAQPVAAGPRGPVPLAGVVIGTVPDGFLPVDIGLGHRAPGVVGAAFDYPEVKVELISDGVHIHPSVVRAVFQLFGAGRVILISDSLRATGMPDGRYPFGGQEIEVHGNRATMADDPNTLAGSVSDLMACMRSAVSFGITLHDAVWAAAVNPAQVLGIFDRLGSLDVGKTANLAILDRDLNLKDVFFRGQLVDRGA